MSYSTEGGAIYLKTYLETYILIEESLFDMDSSQTCGGAIYINAASGDICLFKVCGYDCWSSDSQFAYMLSGSSKKNFLWLVSITKCSTQSFSRKNTCKFINGNQEHKTTNISNNRVYDNSATYCENMNSLKWEYSTIVNNYAQNSGCIYFIRTDSFKDLYLNSLNIVSNDSPSNGIIYSKFLNLNLKNCCLFSNNGILLVGCEYSNTNNDYTRFFVTDCIIYHKGTFYSGRSGFISTTNSTLRTTIGSTYRIDHFSTYLCYNKDILEILQENENNSPCQTLYPEPTECLIDNTNSYPSEKLVFPIFLPLLLE